MFLNSVVGGSPAAAGQERASGRHDMRVRGLIHPQGQPNPTGTPTFLRDYDELRYGLELKIIFESSTTF